MTDAGGSPPAGALDSALLRRASAQLGFALTPDQVSAFERYASELVAWNTRVNLTRITRPDEIAVRHFLDSLICLRGLPDGRAGSGEALSCVDVGSGAGLPGMALAIVRPRWSLTLVESSGKKAAFLEHLAHALGLHRVEVVCDRAELAGQDGAHRERHDLAVARAVAAMPVLAEYLLPLLAVGGRLLALKGSDVSDELGAAARAVEVLGGRLTDVVPYTLPGVTEARHLVVVDKVAPTPARYPRRAGVPRKRPL